MSNERYLCRHFSQPQPECKSLVHITRGVYGAANGLPRGGNRERPRFLSFGRFLHLPQSAQEQPRQVVNKSLTGQGSCSQMAKANANWGAGMRNSPERNRRSVAAPQIPLLSVLRMVHKRPFLAPLELSPRPVSNNRVD